MVSHAALGDSYRFFTGHFRFSPPTLARKPSRLKSGEPPPKPPEDRSQANEPGPLSRVRRHAARPPPRTLMRVRLGIGSMLQHNPVENISTIEATPSRKLELTGIIPHIREPFTDHTTAASDTHHDPPPRLNPSAFSPASALSSGSCHVTDTLAVVRLLYPLLAMMSQRASTHGARPT